MKNVNKGKKASWCVCVLRAEAWVCVSTSVSDCMLVCMTNITEFQKYWMWATSVGRYGHIMKAVCIILVNFLIKVQP